MSEVRGLPLLSGPPPNAIEAAEACRKCNKEFNILLNRSRKCYHCGYQYCHSCTDYQALMPRAGDEATGYSAMNVCGYCIEFLNVTAAGKGQLKSMPLSRLRKYIEAYNIKIARAVEKEDLVEGILTARGPNGCLPPQNEAYYRRTSVPDRFAGSRPRGIFSRTTREPPPPPPFPPPPRPARQAFAEFPRPDLAPDPPLNQQYPPPPHPPPQWNHSYHQPPPPPPPPRYPPPPPNQYSRPTPQAQNQNHTPPPHPHYQPRYQPPPVPPRPQPQPQPQYPPQNYAQAHAQTHGYGHAFPRSEPPTPPQYSRPRSASTQPPSPPRTDSPRPRAQSTQPPPSLDELLDMTVEAISSLSIGQLKAILFKNHVSVGVVLEKGDLVVKVRKLLDDERRERQAQRAREEAEEAERVERQRKILEGANRAIREKEARERGEEVKEGDGEEEQEQGGEEGEEDKEEGSSKAAPQAPPKPKGTAADLERTGLCVICQDEEANIAIVDCGHLAMCRGCSDLIMNSSRECPLCRTRIVTEARLLRIFKS